VVSRVAAVRFSVQAGLMLSRAGRWILFAVVLVTVPNQLGVKLGAALGAAGIVGIAVGFAMQTSLSNVITSATSGPAAARRRRRAWPP
jgi:small-conductance mechanosensitive channel